MSAALIWLAAELGAIVCFIAAAVLAYYDKSGWGWFLFVGVLCGVSGASSCDKKDDS